MGVTGNEHSFPVVDGHSEQAIATIRSLEQQIARLQALQLKEIATYHIYRGGARDVAAELALTLSLGEYAAQKKLELANSLVRRLPHTLTAMERGRIDAYKASKVAEPTAPLSDEKAREVDAIMAERLAGKNPGQLRRSAMSAVHRVDPEGAAERAERRRAERKVELLHGDDAMATLAADLPAEVASAAYARIDGIARTLRRHGEPRTLDQLRADVFADLLLGTKTTNATTNATATGTGNPADRCGDRAGAKADIFVYVDLQTLMGLRDNPAELAGHGTIPAQVARAIAADPASTWRRILTDPTTGAPVDVGRRRYRPPAVTADFVRVRDRHCRYPGCQRPSHVGDLDHATPWAHRGRTDAGNLVGLCRRHHRLKSAPGWVYALCPETARLTVHTPSGQRRSTEPPPLPDPPPF